MDTWPVKKGRRMLIEVEFLKDMDMYADNSVLLTSMYGRSEINPFKGELQVTMISLLSHQEFVDNAKKKLVEQINNLTL